MLAICLSSTWNVGLRTETTIWSEGLNSTSGGKSVRKEREEKRGGGKVAKEEKVKEKQVERGGQEKIAGRWRGRKIKGEDEVESGEGKEEEEVDKKGGSVVLQAVSAAPGDPRPPGGRSPQSDDEASTLERNLNSGVQAKQL